jgi:hypothetical protein
LNFDQKPKTISNNERKETLLHKQKEKPTHKIINEWFEKQSQLHMFRDSISTTKCRVSTTHDNKQTTNTWGD